MSFMVSYASISGYDLVDDGLVLTINSKSLSKDDDFKSVGNGTDTATAVLGVPSYVVVMPLVNIGLNELKSVIGGVGIIRLGRDIAIVGSFDLVRKAQVVIKSLDVKGAGDFIVDFVNVTVETYSKYELLMKDYGSKYSDVKVYRINDLSVLMLVGQKKSEIDVVKKLLCVIDSSVRPSLYYVNVLNRDILSVEKLLKEFNKDVKYVVDVDSNMFLMFDYVAYDIIKNFVSVVDREDMQV